MPYKDKQKQIDWQREARYDKKRLLQIYRIIIGKCEYCGWNKNVEILQFHHRKPKEKSFTFSVGNLGCRSVESILKEIEKCDLICPNCHLKLHFDETSNL